MSERLADAMTWMRQSSQAHREANPDHVVEEYNSIVRGTTEAGWYCHTWWYCHTCVDNAKARASDAM